jgi:hypothetical protein
MPWSNQVGIIRLPTHRQGIRIMSTQRSLAFWELCRQGLPLLADAANDCWEHGNRFELRNDIAVTRSLKVLIDRCNWEIERTARAA